VTDFFYKPEDAWAADFIPFYWKGAYRLFYLKDWRSREQHGEGTPWYQVRTADFVHFADQGQMLARGTAEEQDLYVFTGSVIEANGQFHIFYTGHNHHLSAQGRPQEAVMHAVSDDLVTWRKLPEDTFFAPPDRYEPHDWRDPFVFWNPAAREWGMLLAARLTTGPSRRRGCTAYCASRDLKTWEVREPFWSPGLYYTHECPDLFRLGDWWYLVFSEFSEASLTRYRMSRSLDGPWLVPANDSFDCRTHYAAKTASDGTRRYLFGWNPTRGSQKDTEGGWDWGGNLVVHEIVQEPDGTLSVRVPETVDRAFGIRQPFAFRPGLGNCTIDADGAVEIAASDSFGCAVAGPMPDRCKLMMTVTFAPGTRGCGLMLRASDDLETGYYIRLEPHRSRFVCDQWPRGGDVPYRVGLERPLAWKPGEPIEIKVFVDGTVCEVYVAGKVAMSMRLYDHPKGSWGVFVSEGAARFENTTLHTL